MFFSKKKKKEEKSNNYTKTCNHKWKDFPWYIDSTWCADQTFDLTIIEPYVCIFCKERKNVELFNVHKVCFSAKDADEYIVDIEEKYKDYLGDEVKINDMINDMQLVDREYLDLYNKVVNPE